MTVFRKDRMKEKRSEEPAKNAQPEKIEKPWFAFDGLTEMWM